VTSVETAGAGIAIDDSQPSQVESRRDPFFGPPEKRGGRGTSASRPGHVDLLDLVVAHDTPSPRVVRVTSVLSFASYDVTIGEVTGQVGIGSYEDAGVLTAVELVNDLAARSVPGEPRDAVLRLLARILAIDPPSVAELGRRDVPGFLELAQRMRAVFDDLHTGDVDAAASRLNDLLAEHPAHPHLAKEGGRWRLHHHPVDATLVPMWTAICAEVMARMVASGHANRLGTCDDPGCQRVFVDVSKNGSRRFCSTTCQNRVKAAAFRRRRVTRSRSRSRRR
jgi:predicted RNA-binding Zn ribbon-like protein